MTPTAPEQIAELHATSVDLAGLLTVLGDNLYSSPRVALRELIQNAHDACIRRRIEDGPELPAQITVACDPATRTVTIKDTGSGLTHAEVRECLATIGAGYTAGLRKAQPEVEAIGYFGLGFLSAYAVADSVEVRTTSYQEPDRTWCFRSSDGARFTLAPDATRPVGTRVSLRLKEAHAALATPNALRNLVAWHCPLLAIPVTMAGDASPVNDLTPPWRADPAMPEIRRRSLRQAFAEHFERSFAPLCSWDITDETLGLNGVLWVQDGSSYAHADARSVSVFARGMFVTDKCRDLLPSWAGFLGCVIDARTLTPTASREDVRLDDAYASVREVVHRRVLEGLRALASEQPETWRRVIRRHAESLRGAALADPQLFDLLHEELQVPTSMGDMTLARVVSASGGRILLRMEEANGHEAMLFQARRIPLVLGYRYAAAALCRAYAERKGLEVVELGSAAAGRALFPQAQIAPEARDRLARHLPADGERLVVSRFAPTSIPFLFVTDEEARLKRKLEADEADRQIGSAALRLAQMHLKDVEVEVLRDLVANIDNPLIQRLSKTDMLDERARHVLAAMRSYLLTLSVDIAEDGVDPAAEMSAFFDNLTALIAEDCA